MHVIVGQLIREKSAAFASGKQKIRPVNCSADVWCLFTKMRLVVPAPVFSLGGVQYISKLLDGAKIYHMTTCGCSDVYHDVSLPQLPYPLGVWNSQFCRLLTGWLAAISIIRISRFANKTFTDLY